MQPKIDIYQPQVSVEPARSRQTPNNDFSAMLQRGAGKALQVAGTGVRSIAQFIPGGSFVTAVADLVAGAAGQGGLSSGGDKWKLLEAQNRMQEEGLANSLQLLTLQRKMQQETQTFTALSNVMKSRHEMAKAAISNIR